MKLLLAIVWLHWLGDFVLQTNQMAQNKSTSWKWLSIHIAVYTMPLMLIGWKFAAFNGVAHFFIDAVTSRITKRLWQAKDVHNFFVVIGLDQALHTSLLLISSTWL